MKRTILPALLLSSSLAICGANENAGAKIIKDTGIRVSNETYRIDPTKTYRLTGKFKALKPEKGWFIFGLAPLDGSWKNIQPDAVNIVNGTDTVLAKEAKKGDTTLVLKDSAGWKNGAYLQVKFNTKPDLSDLPNREGIPFSRIEGNIVTLKTSLRKDYPAGTAGRQHESGNSYMYSGAAYQNVPADKWVEFAGEISGESRSGISPRQFWRGTRMVKIMMLTNQHDVMFKDISLDEIE